MLSVGRPLCILRVLLRVIILQVPCPPRELTMDFFFFSCLLSPGFRISATIASFIDQNTLDSLSRTCRQVRAGLLQFRKPLLASTLRCCNEELPVDTEETMRYRARAGNWFYMEDQARTSYDTKAGECARDMVAGCRRCGTVVCRVSHSYVPSY